MQSAICQMKKHPALLSPYNTGTIIAFLPASLPNSVPTIIHIFSSHGKVRKTFYTSLALTSKSLSTAIIRAIQTVLQDTMLAYVSMAGASVICRPATSLALGQNPSCLMSNTM